MTDVANNLRLSALAHAHSDCESELEKVKRELQYTKSDRDFYQTWAEQYVTERSALEEELKETKTAYDTVKAELAVYE